MIRIEFSNDDVKTLYHERLHHPHFRIRRRMEVLYLKSQGVPHKTICEQVQITKPTLTKYLRLYQTGGIAKLKELNFYRRQSALAPYEQFITDSFSERPPHTLPEAAQRIATMTGIERSPAQVRHVLKQFQLKRRKTGTVPGPALTEERLAAQEAFHDGPLTARLTEAKAGQRQVFFVDAAHFVHGAFLGMVWCLVRILLPTPSGRKRLSVLAALDALTHKLVTVTTEGSVTAATVCYLLDKIADLKCPLPITLFLDNARYQHCQQVRDHAAALKIELLFLPAYSPHLNLIERFWRLVKKQCLYNKHYPTFQEFKTAILEFIETAPTKHKQSLSSLLTLKFQSLRKVNIAIS